MPEDKIDIEPAPGRRMKHPKPPYNLVTGVITVGKYDSFWRRALLDGDMVIVERPKFKRPPEGKGHK